MNFSPKYKFWLMLFTVIIILQLPFISIPFKWLESYFHEISHGLTALLTGGSIVQIQLFPNGAGLCTTRGGSAFFISLMGYGGAILWGSLIYYLASSHRKTAQIFSILLIGLLASSILLWVRDLLTLFIVVVLLMLVIAQLKYSSQKHLQTLLQLTGLLVLINSLMSPLYLLDGQAKGDGAALANMTFIPEIIWVVIWFSAALFATYRLSKLSLRSTR
ncbi:M50 family metallopeptidase [Colwellia sp. MB02u-18]|uniref:M50 family metallopeptidase n=1 Tax=unclassified Colwellia TaxID=196834 RepID=UPI0015F59E5B|nr:MULTISPECIES: M50 family metallopeptidase [unclassified Colwellia]MBA6225166.1 M50 family metallopeptidase [Colwellia sp. MB3u-45]MBA6268546.1 M50 family metallopeptidase [Colwellia sp. MB3u-43]MBA6320977.1 M50 family metallopeptidase [Colwellia sp. MB02u-19]MBA6325530.1 M50 family metallopeptidase [Colwellia sp. MB02u-18]MBA6332005.1 M50 family metallopeptidase [Colwellia sp. MB02u-12]